MRKKQFKNPRRVSIILEEEAYQNIIRQALRMSIEEGKPITFNEAARRAFATVYPLNQELFKY